MIRPAVSEDVERIAEMGERFIGQAWERVGVDCDRATVIDLVEGLIANEYGILLVNSDVTAMIGCLVHPWHFNRNVLTATELFWWAEKEAARDALPLVEAAQRAALDKGASTFNMACQHHMRGEALGKLYTRRGFAPSEHVYIKELC